MPWHILGGRALCPSPFSLMGIVNVTPDSFYDGGVHFGDGKADSHDKNEPTCLDESNAVPYAAAIIHALQLLEDGAIVLDVGGESTRPRARAVPEHEEWDRIRPVITGILVKRPDAVISVDTKKSFVAKEALLAGARIINDVSACLFDPALLELVGAMKPGYILMHNSGLAENTLPCESDAQLEHRLMSFFELHLTRLTKAGLPSTHIMLDPGIGFGTTPDQALQMLKILPCLKKLGNPVLVGLSMKSFLGHFFNASVQERSAWTCLVTALLVQQGIVWHRVHDVSSCAKALRFAHALCN